MTKHRMFPFDMSVTSGSCALVAQGNKLADLWHLRSIWSFECQRVVVFRQQKHGGWNT